MKTTFSAADDYYLTAKQADPVKDLAKALKKTAAQVETRAKQLGLDLKAARREAAVPASGRLEVRSTGGVLVGAALTAAAAALPPQEDGGRQFLDRYSKQIHRQ